MKKMLNSTHNKGNANYKGTEIPATPLLSDGQKFKIGNALCWQAGGETSTLIHRWCECKIPSGGNLAISSKKATWHLCTLTQQSHF